MIGWIICFIFMEFLSVCVMIFAKSHGMKNSAICLIPFVAFFVMDKISGGFKVATINVRKFGMMVIQLFIVALLAYLYAVWGMRNLTEKNIAPLVQIMYIPIAFCILVFYFSLIQCTLKVLFNIRKNFKLDWLLCMTLVAIPIILLVYSKPKYVLSNKLL